MGRPEQIPIREIVWHGSSWADWRGRVFVWRDEIYRAITPARADFSLQILELPAIRAAMHRGLLVETIVTPYTLEGYGLILHHRKVPVTSYYFEWPFEALRTAALAVLELDESLVAANLSLRDPHPWNVMFEGSRPTYVDFTSIILRDGETWRGGKDFGKYFQTPLDLMAAGFAPKVRLLGRDAYNGAELLEDFASHRLQRRRIASPLTAIARHFGSRKKSSKQTGNGQFKHVRQAISSLVLHKQETPDRAARDAETVAAQHRAFAGILARLQPRSALMFGESPAALDCLSELPNCRVLVAESDEARADDLYRRFRESGSLAQSVVLYLLDPSPGYGVANDDFPSATTRFCSDVVISLDAIEEIVVEAGRPFDHAVRALSAFTNDALVVVLPSPAILDRINDKGTNRRVLTPDAFATMLCDTFDRVDAVEKFSDGATLFLCTNKRRGLAN